MLKTKIKVGSYYELKLKNEDKLAFGVMYGFESGKNKDVYSLMIYQDKRYFEFPIKKSLFKRWVEEGRIKEITSDEALVFAL